MNRRFFLSAVGVSGSFLLATSFKAWAKLPGITGLSEDDFFHLRQKINDDYATGNIELVDNWIVSATEYDLLNEE